MTNTDIFFSQRDEQTAVLYQGYSLVRVYRLGADILQVG